MAKGLRFGTGGMPLTSAGRTAREGVGRLSQLGLEHLELEFVYQVFLKEKDAIELKQLAKEKNVSLSVHGSYYVNLASEEADKWNASIGRVVSAAARGAVAGAYSVTYHSGFFQGREAEDIFRQVKEGTKSVLDQLREQDASIRISPELTGKPTQFGDLDELLRLVHELREEGYTHNEIGLCIDFAHKYARGGDGRFNTYDEFAWMLEQVSSVLGEDELQRMHIHVSGIEFGAKGEKNHLIYLPSLESYHSAGVEVEGIEPFFAELAEKRLLENKFAWRDLLKALANAGAAGAVVCESPLLELDALLMRNYYLDL